jgi:hypothetical protein
VTCHCTHIALCHQYRASTAANDGECLAPQCPCGGYESGESALGIRDLSTAERYPCETSRGPDRANESDPLATDLRTQKGA